jgi:hypothetical protein
LSLSNTTFDSFPSRIGKFNRIILYVSPPKKSNRDSDCYPVRFLPRLR